MHLRVCTQNMCVRVHALVRVCLPACLRFRRQLLVLMSCSHSDARAYLAEEGEREGQGGDWGGGGGGGLLSSGGECSDAPCSQDE